ncbi:POLYGALACTURONASE QRT3 [Salix koriyanagi]|uniref:POLYGALACTURONASE QRT3 n=1 Tax=Salix koriyanagi TaxID=2511006 RepID=A0A9Q0Q6S7_9ROSI|nr:POLYGALACTURONASE QRT3 [Salix koriyanagi]
MEPAMQRKMLTIVMGLASLLIVHVNGETSLPFDHQKLASDGHYLDQMQKMQAFKHSLLTRRQLATPSTISSSPAPAPQPPGSRPSVYEVTTYGADPTGKLDSTEALLRAITDAFNGPSEGFLMKGIKNLGGAHIILQGGNYLISKPLRLPAAGAGNLKISGGTLTASDDFPTDGYLIDLSASSSSSSSYNYDTEGILVQNGHETYIRNSFLGQHITAGGDPGERNFSGTAINLMGNDNAVTDVVIFSAAIGVMVSGQANTLSGVHCYNKATGYGGTGIYLKLPSLTQTRIVNCYMDYTGIVAEDPMQLTISNSFFLGDAFILLKSINGLAEGINIVDNMFAGLYKGIEIVQLDQSKGPFKKNRPGCGGQE